MRIKQLLKNSIIKGTFILTLAGLLSKLIGFYYKIFLSGAIGAEGIGMYQLAFPVMGLAMAEFLRQDCLCLFCLVLL